MTTEKKSPGLRDVGPFDSRVTHLGTSSDRSVLCFRDALVDVMDTADSVMSWFEQNHIALDGHVLATFTKMVIQRQQELTDIANGKNDL